MPDPPPILLHDERFLVLDKPTGLLSVPGIGPEKADCLAARVQAVHPSARIVHRLDRDTSGVIVMGLDAESHRELSRQFQDREVRKRYEAIVRGVVEADEGTVDRPMRKDMENTPLQVIDEEQGRAAVTHWRVLARDVEAGVTRLELRPITGRSHQLRLHLQSIGHPVLGDDLYADAIGRAMADRLLLHARSLAFTHPGSAAPVDVESPPPF